MIFLWCGLCVLQKTQLKLQEIEIKTVQVSLQEEQRRSRQVQEDREALVNQLQTQIQQLQKERNDYYSKMQELKVKMGQIGHVYSLTLNTENCPYLPFCCWNVEENVMFLLKSNCFM